MVGEGRDALPGVGGGKPQGEGAGGPHGPQPVEAVFQPHALPGGCAETGRPLQIAVGVGLALGKVFAGEHTVETTPELGVAAVHILHLRHIATRYYSALYAVLPQVFNELLEARHILVFHLRLIPVEARRNPGLLAPRVGIPWGMGEVGVAAEEAVVYLHQRLPLDALGEVGHLGMILPAYHAPEDGVLRLGVENHPVQVEERSLYLTHHFLFCLAFCLVLTLEES